MPAMPDMPLSLRVLDLSIGGCALLLPEDVPPLEPGSTLHGVRLELDPVTRLPATLQLQHVSSIHAQSQGLRLGCEMLPMPGSEVSSLTSTPFPRHDLPALTTVREPRAAPLARDSALATTNHGCPQAPRAHTRAIRTADLDMVVDP